MAFTGTMRALTVPAVLVALACGRPPADVPEATGLQVVLDTDAPFARAPDFDARIKETIDVALSYWGGSWSDMDGRSITLEDQPFVDCRGAQALGCYDGNIRLTTRDPGVGQVACVEQTVLVHEIGHLVLGDPDHTDPRWMEMDDVAAQLAGQQGYNAQGVEPCVPHPGVWRHPLGSP